MGALRETRLRDFLLLVGDGMFRSMGRFLLPPIAALEAAATDAAATELPPPPLPPPILFCFATAPLLPPTSVPGFLAKGGGGGGRGLFLGGPGGGGGRFRAPAGGGGGGGGFLPALLTLPLGLGGGGGGGGRTMVVVDAMEELDMCMNIVVCVSIAVGLFLCCFIQPPLLTNKTLLFSRLYCLPIFICHCPSRLEFSRVEKWTKPFFSI